MKWGFVNGGCRGFVVTDIPVVTLSWLGPSVKTSLQNVRGRLFPGTCALWPLTHPPSTTSPPTGPAVVVFVLGDENEWGFSVSLLKEQIDFLKSLSHMTRVYPPQSTLVWTSGVCIMCVWWGDTTLMLIWEIQSHSQQLFSLAQKLTNHIEDCFCRSGWGASGSTS